MSRFRFGGAEEDATAVPKRDRKWLVAAMLLVVREFKRLMAEGATDYDIFVAVKDSMRKVSIERTGYGRQREEIHSFMAENDLGLIRTREDKKWQR